MPIYEYERVDGVVISVLQSIRDEPLKACPDTGLPARKIVSPTMKFCRQCDTQSEGMDWFREKQKAFMARPDVKEKLMDGRYVIDKGAGDNIDGAAGTSSYIEQGRFMRGEVD